MEIRDLYTSLTAAYTAENMGLISGRIISWFRAHQFDALRAVQRVVNDYVPCAEERAGRIFSRLIMIYHPDRLSQSLKKIEEAYLRGDFEELYSMSHILIVQNLEPEQVAVSAILTEDDLAEEFGWDGDFEGFSYFTDQEHFTDQDQFGNEEDGTYDYTARSFMIALKRRIYGNMNVELPGYMLEDLEEIEMADYDIENLEGIESCRFVRVVDLSNNNLTDLSELQDLRQIERLYLSNNHIWSIDTLSNLTVLQVLDLSFNDVDDLSPLFELSHLSYLNVMGNRVPAWQLEQLQLAGVTVVA